MKRGRRLTRVTAPGVSVGHSAEWAQKDLHGVRLEIPRPSVELRVLARDEARTTGVRTRPWFSSAGAWAAEVILPRPGQAVDQTLGDGAGVRTMAGPRGGPVGCRAGRRCAHGPWDAS